jgi:hypothetical protein
MKNVKGVRNINKKFFLQANGRIRTIKNYRKNQLELKAFGFPIETHFLYGKFGRYFSIRL